MSIIDPDDGSRLSYHVTGRNVSVRLDNHSLVDQFSVPEDVAEDYVVLWLLERHHDIVSRESGDG